MVKTLETGVTTVRDLYAPGFTDIKLRDLINSGEIIGPRMFVSGHGLFVEELPPPWEGHAKGVAQVKEVARLQLEEGADWINIYGSTGSADDLSGIQTYTLEEMKAAVELEGFSNVEVKAFHARCGRPPIQWQELKEIIEARFRPERRKKAVKVQGNKGCV